MTYQESIKHIMKDCFLAGVWAIKGLENQTQILPAELFEIWFSSNKETNYWLPFPDNVPPYGRSLYIKTRRDEVFHGVFTQKGRFVSFDGESVTDVVSFITMPF